MAIITMPKTAYATNILDKNREESFKMFYSSIKFNLASAGANECRSNLERPSSNVD